MCGGRGFFFLILAPVTISESHETYAKQRAAPTRNRGTRCNVLVSRFVGENSRFSHEYENTHLRRLIDGFRGYELQCFFKRKTAHSAQTELIAFSPDDGIFRQAEVPGGKVIHFRNYIGVVTFPGQ